MFTYGVLRRIRSIHQHRYQVATLHFTSYGVCFRRFGYGLAQWWAWDDRQRQLSEHLEWTVELSRYGGSRLSPSGTASKLNTDIISGITRLLFDKMANGLTVRLMVDGWRPVWQGPRSTCPRSTAWAAHIMAASDDHLSPRAIAPFHLTSPFGPSSM